MVRTVVSLEETDKEWLDRKAAEEGVAMTELVRRAVRLLRSQQGRTPARTVAHLLDATAGLWRQGDGLAYRDRMRHEW